MRLEARSAYYTTSRESISKDQTCRETRGFSSSLSPSSSSTAVSSAAGSFSAAFSSPDSATVALLVVRTGSDLLFKGGQFKRRHGCAEKGRRNLHSFRCRRTSIVACPLLRLFSFIASFHRTTKRRAQGTSLLG